MQFQSLSARPHADGESGEVSLVHETFLELQQLHFAASHISLNESDGNRCQAFQSDSAGNKASEKYANRNLGCITCEQLLQSPHFSSGAHLTKWHDCDRTDMLTHITDGSW